MKKRILAVVLGSVMVMSLAGCGSGTSGEDKKLPPMEKRLIRSEFPSLQSMVHWITAGKDSLKG